jgi:tripartite-type tricarboxylate transporter receptor subunit TctC
MKIILKAVIGMCASLALIAVKSAIADDAYPTKPIRVVVGFPAGGGSDAVARHISAKVADRLGVPIIVENKPGANGNIAAQYVARSPADGYTVLYNTSSAVLSQHLYAKPGFDIIKDLAPVAYTADIPLILVVNNAVPATTINEFVAYLKANPGKLFYGSTSTGNITHLATVQFLMTVGGNATHVPYKGEAPALIDVMNGQVQFYLGTANGLIPQIKEKKLKALAVTTLKRIDSLPDVPTLAETVVPGMEISAWSGMMAPAKTPPAVIAKLSAEVNKALQDPTLRAKIIATGAEVRGSTPEQYGSFLETELVRWRAVINTAGVKPE